MAKGNYKELEIDTFYTVYKWMSYLEIDPKKGAKKTTKKRLAGIDKEIYAIIYGYSYDGERSCFYSLSQFAEITGATRKSVSTSLKGLEANELISVEREKRGRAYEKTFYKVNLEKVPVSDKFKPQVEKETERYF
ncbi:MAG: helix-turn-helix domain-containing protein [Lachnospiraceae bacterium]|nr:helix-turn-helix domain-containing protein [Lachnospiraceae bacterium]